MPEKSETDEMPTSDPGTGSSFKKFMETEIDFRKFGIQDYLSLGYLYLLILGIITEVVYYKLIGVNILYYSGLMDVLLSPIIFMTKRLTIFSFILLMLILVAIIDRYQRKKANQSKEQQSADTDLEETANNQPTDFLDKITVLTTKHHPKDFFVKISALMVFFMFIGGGIGAGIRQQQKILSGDFECPDILEFVDGETLRVRLVGQNNDFLFYVLSGEKDVTVAPLRGNVKRIRRVADEDLPEADEGKKEAPKDDLVEKAPLEKAK